MGNLLLSCLSTFLTSSCSDSLENPSAPVDGAVGVVYNDTITSPAKQPDKAASSVDTWNSRNASSIWLSRANGANDILANDSAIRIIASNCLPVKERCVSKGRGSTYRTVMGTALRREVSLSCCRAPERIST